MRISQLFENHTRAAVMDRLGDNSVELGLVAIYYLLPNDNPGWGLSVAVGV